MRMVVVFIPLSLAAACGGTSSPAPDLANAAAADLANAAVGDLGRADLLGGCVPPADGLLAFGLNGALYRLGVGANDWDFNLGTVVGPSGQALSPTGVVPLGASIEVIDAGGLLYTVNPDGAVGGKITAGSAGDAHPPSYSSETFRGLGSGGGGLMTIMSGINAWIVCVAPGSNTAGTPQLSTASINGLIDVEGTCSGMGYDAELLSTTGVWTVHSTAPNQPPAMTAPVTLIGFQTFGGTRYFAGSTTGTGPSTIYDSSFAEIRKTRICRPGNPAGTGAAFEITVL